MGVKGIAILFGVDFFDYTESVDRFHDKGFDQQLYIIVGSSQLINKKTIGNISEKSGGYGK